MGSIEVRLCDEDRERFGGPEWTSLDMDRLLDSPAHMLARWEREMGGYAIMRALVECGDPYPPAKAVQAVTWLARKQHGSNADAVGDDGQPESFARLGEMKTMKVRIRDLVVEDDDVDPPAGSAETTSRP